MAEAQDQTGFVSTDTSKLNPLVRVTTSLTVSEPIPVVLTDQIKLPVKGGG